MKLITNITQGKPENLAQFFNNCLIFDGKKVDITIERHKDKRTNPQNRFWRGVVLPLITSYMESNGYDYTEQDWHEYYISKGYFGYKDMNGDRVPKRSSEASTIDFLQAIEKVQREWAERGLDIPSPNEKDYREG